MANVQRKFDIILTLLALLDDDSDEEGKAISMLMNKNHKSDLASNSIQYRPTTIENIISEYYSNFQQYFRMSLTSFENILLKVVPPMKKIEPEQPIVDIEVQLMVTIWMLTNQESFRSVADRFSISESLAKEYFYTVIGCLYDTAKHVITWPNKFRSLHIMKGFEQLSKLSDVIGAIDATCISIQTPIENSETSKNNSKITTVILQAVCDNHNFFTNCYISESGSVDNNTVLKYSDLGTKMEEEEERNRLFPNDSYLVGNTSYPILSCLLIPYEDNGYLTEDQKIFNDKVEIIRKKIKETLALLKGRFCGLRSMEINRIEFIHTVIVACCVLHNICLFNDENDDNKIQLYIDEGMEIMKNEKRVICEMSTIVSSIEGLEKREELTVLS